MNPNKPKDANKRETQPHSNPGREGYPKTGNPHTTPGTNPGQKHGKEERKFDKRQ